MLTITRATDGSGNIVSIHDCYGREIFYEDGTYSNAIVPKPWARSMQLLTNVSQIVPMGTTSSPPNWYSYGYTDSSNGNPSSVSPGYDEEVPFLTSCSMPSPTGTGVTTFHWSYDAHGLVASETDGNGVQTDYSYGSNTSTATTLDAQGNPFAVKTVTYDNLMNGTSTSNAAGQVTSTSTFNDPNDPYRPSSVTDPFNHVTSYTWDPYGNQTSETSARGTVTTNTY